MMAPRLARGLRRGVIQVLATLFALQLIGCAAHPEPRRDRRIAVMEFENAVGAEKGRAVSEWMTASLANYPRVALIDASAVTAYMNKQSTEGNPMQEAGRRAGADYLVLGSVSRVDRNFIVSARLFAISTGEIVKGTSVTRACNREEDLYPITQAIARVLAGQIKYLAEQFDHMAP